MPSSRPPPPSCRWFCRLTSALDLRSAPRLGWLLAGAVLARGRRTNTSWFRAAGMSREYRPCHTTVAAAGRRTDLIADHLAHEVVKPLAADAARVTFVSGGRRGVRHGIVPKADARLGRDGGHSFHVRLWTFPLTEAWAWGRDEEGLVGHRSASPWDDGARRPATRTSGRHGGGNCWPRESARLYVRG